MIKAEKTIGSLTFVEDDVTRRQSFAFDVSLYSGHLFEYAILQRKRKIAKQRTLGQGHREGGKRGNLPPGLRV